MKKLTELFSFNKLSAHTDEINRLHLRNLFIDDKERFNKFHIKFEGILFDYSKNWITDKTISLLLQLADEVNLKQAINDMFSGKEINFTEKRAVLHTALRNRSNYQINYKNKNVMDDVNSVLNKMELFVNEIHSGEKVGFTGKKFTDVINIGIGGSDLGPMMVCNALKPFADKGIKVHFVSNVDATHLAETLKQINPETSLFIISSKSFTTQETLINAKSARSWFLEKTGNNTNNISKHFIAISTNSKAVKEFGIDLNNMFEFWDWVGGRFSLWSAIGMSIALYLGFDRFINLLEGAHSIDLHFKSEEFSKNIPVIIALLSIWYFNFYNIKSQAIIPYDQYLENFPAFLQQLEMESNGKYIDKNSQEVTYQTGGIIWGEPGTNAQHSFFQLIHQGTQVIPVDFIAPIKTHNPIGEQHNILLSNFFAQTEALMKGKTEDEVLEELEQQGLSEEEIQKLLPHKVFKGNRPSNSILIDEINPYTLGQLIAIYEHKVFVQGVIWNINSFDQWGVELGKQLAKKILPELTNNEIINSHDCSTNNLINYFKEKRTKLLS